MMVSFLKVMLWTRTIHFLCVVWAVRVRWGRREGLGWLVDASIGFCFSILRALIRCFRLKLIVC